MLRGPLHGIASHWDEWFRHEASGEDRRAIERVTNNKSTQRQFVSWLIRRWATEAEWHGSRPSVRFVLSQLASVAPFDRWPTVAKYRSRYGVAGVSAVVLAEQSVGESQDVRRLEAVALPLEADPASSTVVSEGFQADSDTLTNARRAASTMLSGRGLLVFLGLWVVAGRRPYPAWVRITLGLGWLMAAALIARLVLGPDPGARLTTFAGALLVLWSVLIVTALGVAATVSIHAWRDGRAWRGVLERSQLRLRMDGGLKVQGGSAGLAFFLAALGATRRAYPGASRRSWLWRQVFQRLQSGSRSWAATGGITPSGRVEPVVLGPKIRACLHRAEIHHVLTPRQGEGRQRAIDRLAAAATSATRVHEPVRRITPLTRLGFASDQRRLRGYQCRHAAQALLAIGGLTSDWQLRTTALALVVSGAMLVALPNLRGIVRPPAPPSVVGPPSPSPYHLWVNLETRHPESFYVVLESSYWANRRSTVAAYGGANASMRAEIRLNRLARPNARGEEDGTVWVERRRRFLTREFAPGERVGRYSFSYVSRLGRE